MPKPAVAVGLLVMLMLAACGGEPQEAAAPEPSAAAPAAPVPPPEEDEALQTAIAAANEGDADMAFQVSNYYALTLNDLAESERWLKKAADLGHEDAQKNWLVIVAERDCPAFSEAYARLETSASAETLAWMRGRPWPCTASAG